MIIRELNVDDLTKVAEVHQSAFRGSALSKLGKEVVRRYYEWQIKGPNECYAIGAFKNEKLIGFCFSGIFRDSLSGFLNKNKGYLITRLMTHPWLIFNPIITNRISLAMKTIKKARSININYQQKIKPTTFSILSIATDPKLQNQGVGKELMKKCEERSIAMGIYLMRLTVHIDNIKAIHFYQNLG